MWIIDILEAFKDLGVISDFNRENAIKDLFAIGCIDKIEDNFIFFSSGRIYSIMEHQFIDKE